MAVLVVDLSDSEEAMDTVEPKAAPAQLKAAKHPMPPQPHVEPRRPRHQRRPEGLSEALIQDGLEHGVSMHDIRPYHKATRGNQHNTELCKWFAKRPLPARVDVHLRAPPE